MASDATFGLLLPHFGDHASPSLLLEGSQKAEQHGIDAVWVRDHLFWHPHDFEGSDPTFVEPFTTLSSIAAVTDTIKLGTAVGIPIRHPLHLTQLYASLSYMSDGRVISGLGGGSGKHEYDAVGLPYDERPQLVKENVDIMKGVWHESDFSYDGEIFSIEDVNIDPKPEDDIPVWYGGDTPASVRRAVEFCDGWFPGRLNTRSLGIRLKQLRELSEEKGRERPTVGYIPVMSIDEDHDRAVERANVDAMLDLANNRDWWYLEDGKDFTTLDDLEGVLLAGTPDEMAEKVQKYIDMGVDHFVFDLRFRFDEFHYCLDLIGDELLPQLD